MYYKCITNMKMHFLAVLDVLVTFFHLYLGIGLEKHGRSVLGAVPSFEHGTGSALLSLHKSEELSLLSVYA